MKKSAGILVYRLTNAPEFLLVHPGGPFYINKDLGVWTIPKGEIEDQEDPLEAAKREFREELGIEVYGVFEPLTPIKQKAGKVVYAWAVEANIEIKEIVSNTFEIEWPPKSGKKSAFPEVDRAGWFTAEEAKQKMLPSQYPLIDELLSKL